MIFLPIRLGARQTPWLCAIEGRGIDYASLERRANRLAWRLRSLGVGPDAIVGLCMRRSPAQVVALLAIFKAGGAYLPLDPTYPRDRLVYMLTDAKPRVVITDASSVKSLPALRAVVLDLDAERPSIVNERATAPPRTTQPDHLAYILIHVGIYRAAERRDGNSPGDRQSLALGRSAAGVQGDLRL